ncbi:MAG: MarR family transcriptional regulator [Bacteroidota bacterium]
MVQRAFKTKTAPAADRTPSAGRRAAVSPDPTQVGALIGEMMSHVHRRSAGDTLAMLNEAGLTMAQLVTLHVLEHGGTRTVSAIAACLRLSPAATSHLVDRLVGEGLVGRVEDPIDRRQKRVTITAAGRRLIDRVQHERTREMSEVVARLSPEVRGQFAQVLVRVIEELSSLPQDMS